MSDFVVVESFMLRHEAEMAKGVLEANGIKSVIAADDCGGIQPGMSFGSAITLSVLKPDLEQAKKLLASE